MKPHPWCQQQCMIVLRDFLGRDGVIISGWSEILANSPTSTSLSTSVASAAAGSAEQVANSISSTLSVTYEFVS